MKKQNLIRNLSMAVLFVGGAFIVGADNNVYAQDNSGYYGSGYRNDVNGGGTLGSGTRTEDGETTDNGGAGSSEDNGLIGSGGGRIGLANPSGDDATEFFQSIWNFFF